MILYERNKHLKLVLEVDEMVQHSKALATTPDDWNLTHVTCVLEEENCTSFSLTTHTMACYAHRHMFIYMNI